jgi:hypothetical protein
MPRQRLFGLSNYSAKCAEQHNVGFMAVEIAASWFRTAGRRFRRQVRKALDRERVLLSRRPG